MNTENCTLANFSALRHSNALKKFLVHPRFGLAVLAGLLLTAAFPKIGIAGAAWVAPGLMLFLAGGTTDKQAFRLGYIAGLAHFLSSLYWLLLMPDSWHGIPLGPALGWLALSAYCALFPALWVWLSWKLCPGRTNTNGWTPTVDQFLAQPWWLRLGWAFVCGVLWVALEIVRGRFLSGFPWNFVGASQYKILPLIQISSATGVYGVSFLVVWTSVSLAIALVALVRKPSRSRSVWGEAALPMLIVAVVAGYGASQLTSIPPPSREIKIALIQPSIPQTVIWDPAGDEIRLKKVIELSAPALLQKPDLLVWPESALPALTKDFQAMLLNLITNSQVPMILSSDDMEEVTNQPSKYYNSSFLVSREGEIEGIYHKRRLVIFGEYIPLIKWLPFLKWFTPIDGGYTSGQEAVPFQLKEPAAKTSVLICFEDMFPQEAREHVDPDTDFLVNLTNDGWFGESAEQWQQAAGAVFRAVENGVPLVRCTNNGLTCWIDAQGRLRQIFEANGSVYRAGYMLANIPLREPNNRTQTLYNRYGDWFGWGCFGLSLGLVTVQFSRNRARPLSTV